MPGDTFHSEDDAYGRALAVPPPPPITSDIPPEAATWIEMAAAALFGAANMGDPDDMAEALEGHGKREAMAGRAAGEFSANDAQQAQGMDQMAQQIPQMMSSVAGAISGAVGGAMQPFMQMPQQLAQTAQQLMQSGMGAFQQAGGASGTEALGAEDLMAGDFGDAGGGSAGDLGTGGSAGGGGSGGGVGGGLGTSPMAMLGPPATPAATTTPTAGRITAGPPPVPATTAHPPTAMGGMGGVPMMPPGMHGAGAAGGKDDKAATKRVTVPVVKNGAPVQGRITSPPPAPVVTKSVDGEKKITTRRIVVPNAANEKPDEPTPRRSDG